MLTLSNLGCVCINKNYYMYVYVDSFAEPPNQIPKFDAAPDWEKELERLKVRGYRMVTCNTDFRQCPRYCILLKAVE